jgi:hypothetical protein
MGTAVTNGYDVAFEVSEPAFRKQLAALPALQQTVRTPFNAPPFAGRARVHLSKPSAEFKSPPFVMERITISVDIGGSAIVLTQPMAGLIPLEGTLELGGRVRVRTPTGTATREVILDFTTNNGGPDLLQLTFPPGAPATSAGLQSIGIQPNQAILDLVRNLVVGEVRTWVMANLSAVPLAAPIAVAATPAGAFTPTQVDAHVIEDPSGPDRDALVIALATCMGANPALTATAFTMSSVPANQDAAVLVSNATLLGCVVCPAVQSGLGLPASAFGPPCTLITPVGITLPGAPPVVLTSLTATVSGGTIAIRGTIARTTVVWSFTGTFGVDIALTLTTTATGPAITPVVTVLPSTVSLTVVWWAWALAAVVLAVLFPVVIAAVILIAAAIANGIANSGLAAAITAGIAGSLPGPGAIPLGPLASSFAPATITLDDLTLTGSIAVAAAPDTQPRLVITDSARQPIDAVQLTPRLEQTSSTFTIYVHNRGTTAYSLLSVTKVDDPANAFSIPDGSVLPHTIQPGQLYALPCRFQPPQAGLYLPLVSLTSDDPFGPARADIEARALPLPPHGRLELTPDPVDFGKVVATTQATKSVTFKNAGNASLDVTNVQLTNESPLGWFQLPWSWPYTIAAGQAPTLPITFSPPHVGMGTASLAVDISSANGVYKRSYALSLIGRAGAPVIRLDPALLDFGALPPSTSGSSSFVVHNDGDMDLEVIAVWRVAGQPDFILDPAVTFPLTVPAGGQQTIGVTTTAAPWPGYVNTNEFDIQSNDPATPMARLICRAAAAGPRLEFRPDFIEMHRPPAVPATATVTLYNRGSSQLDVGPVKIGAPFSLVGLPGPTFTVPAGGSQSFDVQFSPTSTGDFIDYVRIRSNDALHPNVSVGIHAAW